MDFPLKKGGKCPEINRPVFMLFTVLLLGLSRALQEEHLSMGDAPKASPWKNAPSSAGDTLHNAILWSVTALLDWRDLEYHQHLQ